MKHARTFAKALALAAASAWLLAACTDNAGDSTAAPAAPPPEVGVVELRPQRVELSVTLPGRTTAFAVAEVRPQVTGILQERLFTQGAQVEAGQVLYRIDPRPYRAAVARAEAELVRARAAVTAVRVQERRYAALLKDRAVSQQEYDDVKAQLDQRLADVQAAKAVLESAQIDLDYTSIEAPIGGIIGPTLVTAGALVTANQAEPLARVTRLDPVYVDIQRSASDLRQLRERLERGRMQRTEGGRPRVELLLDDGTVYPHPGELEVQDVTVNPATGSVTLRAVVPNPDGELLPGMYVRARVGEGVRENAILAPQQGVTRDPQGEATALVIDDGKVVERRLVIGQAIGSFWLVEKGLSAGDRLIVSGLQKIRPGAPVRPVSAEIPNRPENRGGSKPAEQGGSDG